MDVSANDRHRDLTGGEAIREQTVSACAATFTRARVTGGAVTEW